MSEASEKQAREGGQVVAGQAGRGFRAVRGRGFTLIELLVVISIIALLIGILLPALAFARNTAKSVQCLSGLRGFLQAALIYGNDNKGFVPRDYNAGQRKGSGYDGHPHILLPEVTSPYLGGPNFTNTAIDNSTDATARDGALAFNFARMKAMKCPSYTYTGPDKGGKSVTDLITGASATLNTPPYQYCINAFLWVPDVDDSVPSKNLPATGSAPPTTIDRVPTPSRLIYLTEVNSNIAIADYNTYDMHVKSSLLQADTTARMIGINDGRHVGGFNSAFYDGHAAGKKLKGMMPEPCIWFTNKDPNQVPAN